MQVVPGPGLVRNPDDPLINRFIKAIDAGSASDVTRTTEGRLYRVREKNDFVLVTSTEFLSDIDGCVHDEITQSASTRDIEIKWGCRWQANVRRAGVRQEDMTTYVTTIRFTAGVPSYFYQALPLGGRSPATLKQQSCEMLRHARDQSVTLSTDVEAALKTACTG